MKTEMKQRKKSFSFRKRLALTTTIGLQYALAAFVMLLLMTYNVWVFISIVLGHTISYFIFVSKNDFEVIEESCH